MTDGACCIAPLFVPAHRPDRFAKAAASYADVIILDLEDGVPIDAKDSAREALGFDFKSKPVIVRINAFGTRWYDDDIKAVLALRPAAVMLPKVEDAAQCASLANSITVIALIETARGVGEARAIARSGLVRRLAFGSVDLAADLGCAHDRQALAYARAEIVLSSRIGDLAPPLDGVTTGLADPGAVEADARHACAIGFGGKMAIHPTQLQAVLSGFTPSDDEIDWAIRVLASGDGATSLDGAMVDEPVRKKAKAILARSQSLGAGRPHLGAHRYGLQSATADKRWELPDDTSESSDNRFG